MDCTLVGRVLLEGRPVEKGSLCSNFADVVGERVRLGTFENKAAIISTTSE